MDQKDLWETMMSAMNGPYEERRYLCALAKLAETITNGHGETLEAGTRVKVTMASRFGDVGITPNLTAKNGYDFRVQCVDWWKAKEGWQKARNILEDIELLEKPHGNPTRES